MAALTATTPIAISCMGSKKLLKVDFSDSINDGDTWASGLKTQVGILSYWVQTTDASAGEEGLSVGESSGTFTFTGASTHSATLYVLCDV